MTLYGRLRSEGLSHDKAMEVVKEDEKIRELEVQGMTRSDAQGVWDVMVRQAEEQVNIERTLR